MEVPAAYRYEVAEARDTANAAWWQQFQDPVLDGLIAEALAHNLNVKIAAANVEQAAAVLTQASAPLYPQVELRRATARESAGVRDGADADPGQRPQPADLLPGPGRQRSWEIDLWGRIRRLSEAARAQLLATEEARRGVDPLPRRPRWRTATSSSAPSTSSS